MKRVVLDTNIVISSALGGALVLILERWDEGKFAVIVTSDILSEYFEVLNRPKFRLKQEAIDKIARYLYQFSEFVVPEERIQLSQDASLLTGWNQMLKAKVVNEEGCRKCYACGFSEC
ncbi:MAG: PIN domain-containing protein [Anaerolineaceae bacterium]|nr:MAG: PIN domain-containing protein [Anaerolineaceae bacterium]